MAFYGRSLGGARLTSVTAQNCESSVDVTSRDLSLPSVVEVCETCCGEDLMEYEEEPGFEGEVVTVCAECGAVYDPVTGALLDEGQA